MKRFRAAAVARDLAFDVEEATDIAGEDIVGAGRGDLRRLFLGDAAGDGGGI